MSDAKKKTRKSLLKRLRGAFSELEQCEELDLQSSFKLGKKKVRVPLEDCPIQVNIGEPENILHLYPERPLSDEGQRTRTSGHYILVNPDDYFSRISGFYRLDDGDKLTLGKSATDSKRFLNLSNDGPTRAVRISNEEGSLCFKSRDQSIQTCITPLIDKKSGLRLKEWRIEKLRRLKSVYGGRISPLPAGEALSLISQVNDLMAQERYRPPDRRGGPGGIVELPAHLTPIIVGDLHTSVDNLLTLLSQNYFLEGLEEGSAALIILGDAVHPDRVENLAEMESSILIMDLIFKLKIRFPDGVFYLRGNHDSFSRDIAKGGIPQGLLWEKALINRRGTAYRDAMQTYYDRLPYIAYSEHFVACHAGPPTSAADKSSLINIQRHPQLIVELVNNRLQSATRVAGYNKGHLNKLRKILVVDPDTPIVVGHTPITDDETIWESPNQIDHHIVVYGSDDDWIGSMVGIDGVLYPFRYPAERMTRYINELK